MKIFSMTRFKFSVKRFHTGYAAIKNTLNNRKPDQKSVETVFLIAICRPTGNQKLHI